MGQAVIKDTASDVVNRVTLIHIEKSSIRDGWGWEKDLTWRVRGIRGGEACTISRMGGGAGKVWANRKRTLDICL